MSVHSVDSSGKGSGKAAKKLVPTAPVANSSGVIKVVRNPAVVPGATVAPGASTRVLTQVTALPKAAAPAQPTLDVQTSADNTDDAAAAPATSADFGKIILQNAGIAPEAPTLQTRTQYIALANYLMASSHVESAPVAAHDAPPVADAGGHASVAHTSATHTAGTRRIDVSA